MRYKLDRGYWTVDGGGQGGVGHGADEDQEMDSRMMQSKWNIQHCWINRKIDFYLLLLGLKNNNNVMSLLRRRKVQTANLNGWGLLGVCSRFEKNWLRAKSDCDSCWRKAFKYAKKGTRVHARVHTTAKRAYSLRSCYAEFMV